MFEEALFATRIHMTTAERQQFYDKHIRQMKLVLDEEGNARIELKNNRKSSVKCVEFVLLFPGGSGIMFMYV